MTEPPVWYVGDRNPSITDTVTVNGVAQDLTGKTCRFKMRLIGSSTLKVDQAVSNVPGVDGVLRYDWAAVDVDTAGFYVVWWEVTTGGKVQAVQEAEIEIRTHGPTSGWLCEIEDVRQAMETKSTDRDLDDQIARLIPAASSLIQAETQRELVPTATATRDFRIAGNAVDLSPYDLRQATAVTLDPGGAATLLAAGAGGYELRPFGGTKHGVYTEIVLSKLLTLTPSLDFGSLALRVAGAWGFATVPEEARQACIVTVRSWTRRDLASYAQYDPDVGVQPAPIGTYALPLAAKTILRTLNRHIGVF